MIKSLFTPSGAPATYLKKLREERRSVVFRLTLWYAGAFAALMVVTAVAFYLAVLHQGSHGVSHHALSELREDFRHYFGIPLAVVILLTGGVGWLMAKRALAGIGEVTRAAVDIAEGAFHRRVPVTGRRDEIDRLAVAFNTMVDETQALIGQMREITENIAHDLRSPITRMRGVAEMALSGAKGEGELAAMAGLIIEECDRLLDLINTMLDISEAETGLVKAEREDTDLAGLIADLADLFQPSAEEKEITLEVRGAANPIRLPCDRRKLTRVFANLLDNALKYTPSGGRVTLALADREAAVTVAIDDTGPGVADDDLPHIFDRFYRGEKSRSTPGSGLGLSLALAFTLIHGGTITPENLPTGGARFTVTLPKAASPGRRPSITKG